MVAERTRAAGHGGDGEIAGDRQGADAVVAWGDVGGGGDRDRTADGAVSRQDRGAVHGDRSCR